MVERKARRCFKRFERFARMDNGQLVQFQLWREQLA